jgi:hypothetical protein
VHVVKCHGRIPNDWVQAVAIARVRTTRITKDRDGDQGHGSTNRRSPSSALRCCPDDDGGVPFDRVL